MEKDSRQFIEIGLDQERYGIPILEIQEIIHMQAYTDIPNLRKDIYGIINLRGKIIPILSLRSRFRMPPAETIGHSRIIIVNLEGDSVGIVVDKVFRVTSFSRIHPPQDKDIGAHSSYISSIGENDSNSHLISILNLQMILQDGGGSIA